MSRTVRRTCSALFALFLVGPAIASSQPLPLLDVPFISQSEALCGGAAAAMVLRYWGATGLTAESFAPLLNRGASGIETTVLVADVRRRGYQATAVRGDAALMRRQLERGRPVIALVEDRPGTFHYVVVVAWHERGVFAHDPARAPFQVIAPADFERRWSRGDRWMLVITPPPDPPSLSAQLEVPRNRETALAPQRTCEQLIADGIREAQANDLVAAERSLTRAFGCPGSAPARELAGVRLLQRRWPEVRLLASQAVASDRSDSYAWRLLGSALFVSDESIPALAAWNHVGEPTIDLIRVDGLRRTRQRVIERLVGLQVGEMLTPAWLLRGRRQLAELPASMRSSLGYQPTANGLVQLRAAVVERNTVPTGWPTWAGTAIAAAIDRQVDVDFSSLSGGGERLVASYRFWKNRPRYAIGLSSPAPWGGVWGVTAAYEEQAFVQLPDISRHQTAELSWARWLSATLRTELVGGMGRWRTDAPLAAAGGRLGYRSSSGRFAADAALRSWFGTNPFATWETFVAATTSADHRGFETNLRLGASGATSETPFDMWASGDVGQVRPTLLRAHPLLDSGRMRSERLGRILLSSTAEAQRWHRLGPASIAAAAFVDVARIDRRRAGAALTDVDGGIGARFATPLMPGVIRIDLAKGLRDGATALSIVYAR